MSIQYAQFNEEGICICVGTPNITGVIATEENLGQKYVDGVWEDVPQPEPEPQPYQPTNAEVAQMISDLQADLIIAGVI